MIYRVTRNGCQSVHGHVSINQAKGTFRQKDCGLQDPGGASTLACFHFQYFHERAEISLFQLSVLHVTIMEKSPRHWKLNNTLKNPLVKAMLTMQTPEIQKSDVDGKSQHLMTW